MEFINNDNRFQFELGNMNLELFMKYEKELELALQTNERRFWHSISVAITSVTLADIYGEDKDNCLIAGLLHDFCKSLKLDELLIECEKYGVVLSEEDRMADGCIHGFLAAKKCKVLFNINDEIYDAIYYHTCGRPNMTTLEKIIYIADFIEPLRRFRDKISDIRKLAYKDIDAAIVFATEKSLEFLKNREKFIHSNTIKTHDYYQNLIGNRRFNER